MPKADRGVAQRFAAKKRKRRTGLSRPETSLTGTAATIVDQEAAEVAPPAETVRRPVASRVQVITAARTRPAARPFSAYAEDYRYVVRDLRRVFVVAGGLLVVLLVLSTFIQ